MSAQLVINNLESANQAMVICAMGYANELTEKLHEGYTVTLEYKEGKHYPCILVIARHEKSQQTAYQIVGKTGTLIGNAYGHAMIVSKMQ